MSSELSYCIFSLWVGVLYFGGKFVGFGLIGC